MRRMCLPWLKIALAVLCTAEFACTFGGSSSTTTTSISSTTTTTTEYFSPADIINTFLGGDLPSLWPYDRWLPIGICKKYKLCMDCDTCGLEANDEWLRVFWLEVLRVDSGEHCTGLSDLALPKTNESTPTIRIGIRWWETSQIVGGMAQIILEELLNLKVEIVNINEIMWEDDSSTLTEADEVEAATSQSDTESGVEPAGGTPLPEDDDTLAAWQEAWWKSTDQAIRDNHIDLEVESWDMLSALDWDKPYFKDHTALGSAGYRGQAGIYVTPHLIKVLEEEESHVTSNWRAAVEWFQWLRGTPSVSMPQEVIDAIYRHLPMFGETLRLAGIGDEHVVQRVPSPVCVACNNTCCVEVFLRAWISPSGAGVPATRLESIMLAWDLRIVLTYISDEEYYPLTIQGAHISLLTWGWQPFGTASLNTTASVRVQFMYDGMLASQGMSEVFDWPAFSLLKVGNARIMEEYPVLAMVLEKLTVRREDLNWDLQEFVDALVVLILGYDRAEAAVGVPKVTNCLAMRTSQDTKLLPYWEKAISNCRDLKTEVVDGYCSAACLEGEYLNKDRCTPCSVGYYCPTETKALKCRNGTTTNGEGKTSIQDCMCGQGKELIRDKIEDMTNGEELPCVDCPKGLYKSTVDNAPCHQSCPPNAFMDITGAENDMYCSCRGGFYLATLYGSQRCISCPKGAVCAGGFNLHYWSSVEEVLAVIREGGPDLWKVHTPPIAAPGYYGLNLTLPTDISAKYTPIFVTCVKDSLACEGNNTCAQFSSGERCLICVKGSARGDSPQCAGCPSDARNILAIFLALVLMHMAYLQVVRLVRWAATHYNVLSPMIIKIIINYFQSLNAVFVITQASSVMSKEAGWVSGISKIIVALANLSNAVGLARKQLLCSTHTITKLYFGEEKYQEFTNEEWELLLTKFFFYTTALIPIFAPLLLTLGTFVCSLIFDIPHPHWRGDVVKKIKSCRAMQAHVAKKQPHCKAAIELMEDHINDLKKYCSRFWLWTPLRLALIQKPELLQEAEESFDADDESDEYNPISKGKSSVNLNKIGKGLSKATGVLSVAFTNTIQNMLSIWTLFWFWVYYSTICGLLQLTCYCVSLDYMDTTQYRLMMCPQLTCFEGDHENLMIAGVAFLVFHGVASPLSIRTLVHWKKTYGVDVAYGLHTNGYDHSGSITVYWDVVFLVRSFFVSCVVYFRTKDMSEVVPRTFLMVYLLVSLALQSFYRPFDARRDGILNDLEVVSLLLLSVSVPVFEVIVENPELPMYRIVWVCGLLIHSIFIARCIRQLLRDGVNMMDRMVYTRLYEVAHRKKGSQSKQRERAFLENMLVNKGDGKTPAKETAADNELIIENKMEETKVKPSERPQKEASLERPRKEVSLERPRKETSLERPRKEASLNRPRKEASTERPRKEASTERPRKKTSKEHRQREAAISQMLTDEQRKFSLGESVLGKSAARAMQQSPALAEAALKGMQKSLSKLSEMKTKAEAEFQEELGFDSDSTTSSEGSSSGFSESTSSFSGDSAIIVLEQQISSKKTRVAKVMNKFGEYRETRLVPLVKANTPELILGFLKRFKRCLHYITGSAFVKLMRRLYKSLARIVKPHVSLPVVQPSKSGFEFSGAAHKLSTYAHKGTLTAMSIQLKIQMENITIVGAFNQIFRCVIRGHKLHTIPLGLLKYIASNAELTDHPRVYLSYGGRKAVGMSRQIQKMGKVVDNLLMNAGGDDDKFDYMYNLMALNDAMERVLNQSAEHTNTEVSTRILEFTALNWQNRASSVLRKNLKSSSWFRARPPTMDRSDHEAVEPSLSSKAELHAPSQLKLPRSTVESQNTAAISSYIQGFMSNLKVPHFWDLHVAQAIGLIDMEGMENAQGSKFLRQKSAASISDGNSELSLGAKTISSQLSRALSRGASSSQSRLSIKVSHLHDLRSATSNLAFDDDEDEQKELSSEDIRELVDHSTFIDHRARSALKLLVPEAALLILDHLSDSVESAKISMKSWLASLAISTLRTAKVEPLVKDESALDLVFRQFKKTLPILGLRDSDGLVYELGERLNRVILHHGWESSHREWFIGILIRHMRYFSIRWTEIGVPMLSSEEMAMLRFYDSPKVFSTSLEEISHEWSNYEPPTSDLKAWQTWHALRRHMTALLSLSDTLQQPSANTLVTQQRNRLLDNAHAALRGSVKSPKARRQQRAQSIYTEQSLMDEEHLQMLQSLTPDAFQEAQRTYLLALEEWRHRCMDWAFGVSDIMMRVPICSVTIRENAYVHEREDYQRTQQKPWSARHSPSIMQDNVLKNAARIFIKSEHYPRFYLASPVEDSSEAHAVVAPQGALQGAQGHMGTWLIQKVHETGQEIMHGDEIFLQNLYGSGSFLDAREQNIDGGAIWCVSAEELTSKGGGRADAFRISNKKGYGPIHFGEEVMIADVGAKHPDAYIAAEPPARHPFKDIPNAMSELTPFPISTTLHSPSGDDSSFKGYWIIYPADSRKDDFKCYRRLFPGTEVPPGVMGALCTRGAHKYVEVEPTHTGSMPSKSGGEQADTWHCCICHFVGHIPKINDDYNTFEKHWWCEGCDMSFCQKCYKLLNQWEPLQKMAESLGKQVAVVECTNCKKTWDWEDIEYNVKDTCHQCGHQLKLKVKNSHAKHSFTNLQRLVKNKRHILVDLLLKLDSSWETYLMSPVGTFTGRDVIHWFAIQLKTNTGGMFKNKYCEQGFHQMEELTMSSEADPTFKCKSCGRRTLRHTSGMKDDAKPGIDFAWRKRADRMECVSCSNCLHLYCPRCKQVMDAVVHMYEVIERCGKMGVLDASAVCLLKTVINDWPAAVLEVILELESKADWERELHFRPSTTKSGRRDPYIHIDTVSRWAGRRLQELCGEDYMKMIEEMINSDPRKPEITRTPSKTETASPGTPLSKGGSAQSLSISIPMTWTEEEEEVSRSPSRMSRRTHRSGTGLSKGTTATANRSIVSANFDSSVTLEGNQYSTRRHFRLPEASEFNKASKGVGTDPEDAQILQEVDQGQRDPASLELQMQDPLVKELTATAWGDRKIQVQQHVECKSQRRSGYAEMGVQVEFAASDALAVVQEKLAKREGPNAVHTILHKDRYKIRAEDSGKASTKQKKTAEQLQIMQDVVTQSKEILAKAVNIQHINQKKPSQQTKKEMLQMLGEVKDLHDQRRRLTESQD